MSGFLYKNTRLDFNFYNQSTYNPSKVNVSKEISFEIKFPQDRFKNLDTIGYDFFKSYNTSVEQFGNQVDLSSSIEKEKKYNPNKAATVTSLRPEIVLNTTYIPIEDKNKEYFELIAKTRQARYERIQNLLKRINENVDSKNEIINLKNKIANEIQLAQDELTFFTGFYKNLDNVRQIFDVDTIKFNQDTFTLSFNKIKNCQNIKQIFNNLKVENSNYGIFSNTKKISQLLVFLKNIFLYQSDVIFDQINSNLKFKDNQFDISQDSFAKSLLQPLYEKAGIFSSAFSDLKYEQVVNSSLSNISFFPNKRIILLINFLSKLIRISGTLSNSAKKAKLSNQGKIDINKSQDYVDSVVGVIEDDISSIEANETSLLGILKFVDTVNNEQVLSLEENDLSIKKANYVSGYDYFINSMISSDNFLNPSRLEKYISLFGPKYSDLIKTLRLMLSLSSSDDQKYLSSNFYKQFLQILLNLFNWENKTLEPLSSMMLVFQVANSSSEFRKKLFRYFVYSNAGLYKTVEPNQTLNKYFSLYFVNELGTASLNEDPIKLLDDLDSLFKKEITKIIASQSDIGKTISNSLYVNDEFVFSLKDFLLRIRYDQLNAAQDPLRSLSSLLEGFIIDFPAFFGKSSNGKLVTQFGHLSFTDFTFLIFDTFLSIFFGFEQNVQLTTQQDKNNYKLEVNIDKITICKLLLKSILDTKEIKELDFSLIKEQLSYLSSNIVEKNNTDVEKLLIKYYNDIFNNLSSLTSGLEYEDALLDQCLAFLQNLQNSVQNNLQSFLLYLAPDGPNKNILKIIQGDAEKNNKFNGFSKNQLILSINALEEYKNNLSTNEKDISLIDLCQNSQFVQTTSETEIYSKLLSAWKVSDTKSNLSRILAVGLPYGLYNKISKLNNLKNSNSKKQIVKCSIYYENMLLEGIKFSPIEKYFDLGLFVSGSKTFNNLYINRSKYINFDDFVANGIVFRDCGDINSPQEIFGKDLIKDSLYKSSLSHDKINELITNHILDFILKIYLNMFTNLDLTENNFLISNILPQLVRNRVSFDKIINTYFVKSLGINDTIGNIEKNVENVKVLLKRTFEQNPIFNQAVLKKISISDNTDLKNEVAAEALVDLLKLFNNNLLNTDGLSQRIQIVYPKIFERIFALKIDIDNLKIDNINSDKLVLDKLIENNTIINVENDYYVNLDYLHLQNVELEKYYTTVEIL